MADVVVIGGGISGLACAEALLRLAPDTPLLLLEGERRLGGNIRTSREDGFTIEWGVNGFLNSVPETLALARRIGLAEEILPAGNAAGRRFIYRAGRLREIPLSPPRFLASDVLSLWGRLRVLGEPFAPARRAQDESVFSFAARRIGREAAEILVDSMVSGVYAGDARQLSLRSTFPKMEEMEREHGSLVRAMIRRRRRAAVEGEGGDGGGGPAGPAGALTSFRDGMESLVSRLEARIGRQRVRPGGRVVSVLRRGAAYQIQTTAGSVEAERLIVAAPARHASAFLAPLDRELAGELSQITYAGLAVVALAYRVSDLREAPEGFGFLVPRNQGLRIIGCLWDSSVFAGRAPEGWVLLRAMIGGAQDQNAVQLDDETLLETVRRDLQIAMGIDAPPRRTWIFRHSLGIPQYMIGHGARLARIEDRLRDMPGLALTGNSYRGVAVNNCVAEADSLARRWTDAGA